jgi:hypothetical protein
MGYGTEKDIDVQNYAAGEGDKELGCRRRSFTRTGDGTPEQQKWPNFQGRNSATETPSYIRGEVRANWGPVSMHRPRLNEMTVCD